MTAITDFTTYAEVRSALGVSTQELKDQTIGLPMYAAMMEMDLENINPIALTRYKEIAAIDPASGRTPLQAAYYRVVRVYATYASARFMIASLPMFAVQVLKDGKAEFDRFKDAYKDTVDGIDALYISLQWRLGLALDALEGGGLVLPDYGVAQTSVAVALSVDPVTTGA